MEQMVQVYQEKFGLNDPLWKQYLVYLKGIFRLDFGYSMANYPTTVATVMRQAIPWTAGLLFTATILAFIIGTILGWPQPEALAFIRDLTEREESEARLQEVQGEQVVFLSVGEGAFEKRAVQMGREQKGQVEIVSGLSAGERIVTRGGFFIKSEFLKSSLAEE